MLYEHVCVFNGSMITQFKVTLANELESSVYDCTFRNKTPYIVDSQRFGILTYK
jgi:hypothetical protein